MSSSPKDKQKKRKPVEPKVTAPRASDAPADPTSVPRPALVFGYAGIIPFVAGAILMWTGPAHLLAGTFFALLGYGAIILSFLGGVHWGAAMAQGGPSASRLGLSIIPALAAWLAFLAPAPWGLVVLAAGFAAMLAFDQAVAAIGWLPSWYGRLRLPLSLIVIAALLAAALSRLI